jgi:excisionase family DNA binding protein
MAPLLRISELARFWELHPRTVQSWINEGRLRAVRTPGNQYRLRPEDVRAFCEAEKRPLPPALEEKARALLLVSQDDALKRTMKRALRAVKVELAMSDDAYDALLASVATQPTAIVLDVSIGGFDAPRWIRALRRVSAAPLLVIGERSAAKREAAVRAGATRALSETKRDAIARAAVELVIA